MLFRSWICVAIGVVVFGAMIYSLVKYRKSQGAVPDTTILHSDKVEFIWTVVPVFILVAMAVPAAKTLLAIEDMSGSELTVKVTGYQWQWRYDYLDTGVGFYSRLAETSNRARQLNSGIEPTTVDNYLLEVDNPPEPPWTSLRLTGGSGAPQKTTKPNTDRGPTRGPPPCPCTVDPAHPEPATRAGATSKKGLDGTTCLKASQ